MEQIKLGLRLEAVASFIRDGAKVADIGTDHGFLPIWLRKSGLASSVIASDLNPAPLATAKRNAERYKVTDIQFRLSFGLQAVDPEEVDTVVISGMSGETIVSILAEAAWFWGGKRLVLEANTKHPELLTWLYQNDLHIEGERTPVDNGRCYRVYCAELGRRALPRPAYLWGGFSDSPYARRQADLLKKSLLGLERSSNEEDLLRKEEYQHILEDMLDAYHW